MAGRLLKTKEAAPIMGLAVETLKQWAYRNNKLPFRPVKVGRAVRWPEHKVIAFARGEYNDGCNDTMSNLQGETGGTKQDLRMRGKSR
jgi:predicted DNA-binding transcriptional regulator AlpA